MSNLATFNSALRAEKTQAMIRTALNEDANEYIRNITALVSNDPKLQACDPVTLICGGLTAAQLHFSLNKSLGHAWLIPYNNHGKMEAQFQLGAKGIIQLAQRSGEIDRLNVTEVYEGEVSSYDRKFGTIELNGKKKSDKVVGYFAIFRLRNGQVQELYMTKEEVIKHAQRFSKSFNNGPWKTDFDAMAKKTVLNKLLRAYAPLSIEARSALDKDQAVIREGNVLDYVDNPTNGVDEQEQVNDAVEKVKAKANKVKKMAKEAISGAAPAEESTEEQGTEQESGNEGFLDEAPTPLDIEPMPSGDMFEDELSQ